MDLLFGETNEAAQVIWLWERSPQILQVFQTGPLPHIVNLVIGIKVIFLILIFYFLLKGKSLSLICGVLTWLRDYERKQQDEVEKVLQAEQGWLFQ